MLDYIPFSLPEIGEEEIDEVAKTLRSGWLTTGKRTERFQEEFAQYTHAKHALGVNSCTSGLHLALAALGLGPGDEVITTPLTFCATVNTILYTGASPVLADVDADGNIDPDSIERKLTERTKAILPVHLAGSPCDMDRIWEIAGRKNLRVVEDAAHAAGTTYRGEPIGSSAGQSDATVFSFYATKNMTTGEGGMVTVSDADLHSRMRVLCLHGISQDAWNRYGRNGSWQYDVLELGFKYNLSDIQSAIGIHQLRKLDRFMEARTRHAALYAELLRDVEEVELPRDSDRGRHAWHLYMLRLNLNRMPMDRARFVELLRERGVSTSVHFIPIPLHTCYRDWANRPENDCPQAMRLYPRLVSLPMYSALTERDIERVCAAVKDVLSEQRLRSQVQVA